MIMGGDSDYSAYGTYKVGYGLVGLVFLILLYIGAWIYVVDGDDEFMMGTIAYTLVIFGTLSILIGLVTGARYMSR
jgi:hypothetical protein